MKPHLVSPNERSTKTMIALRGGSRRHLALLAGLALLATTGLAACGSSSGATSSDDATNSQSLQDDLGGSAAASALQALYQKAVAAGQTEVVIYGPTSGSDQAEYDAFNKAFPKIKITGVPVVGPPMDAKLSAEFGSGKHVGDIAYTGSTNMLQYSQKGYFAPFTPYAVSNGAQLVADSVSPQKDFYGVTASVAGTVTNTGKVKTPPKTYADFEDPSYQGQLAMSDPTAIGSQADIFAHLALEPQYANLMSALKTNDVQLFPPSAITGPLTAVAQGAKSAAIGVGYSFYQEAKQKGAPVAFTLFDADNYTTVLYQAQLKDAPHPLAAQLYEDWMFTPAAAKAIAQEGSYSTVSGSVAPEGLPPLSQIPVQKDIPLSGIVAADNTAAAAAAKYWGS
jgi:iron(III) transport system substrate-binding protein